MPPTASLFSGLAVCQIAMAAAGQAEHLEEEAPARMPAVGSPAKKRLMSPLTVLPVLRIEETAHFKEKGHVPDVVQAERNQ